MYLKTVKRDPAKNKTIKYSQRLDQNKVSSHFFSKIFDLSCSVRAIKIQYDHNPSMQNWSTLVDITRSWVKAMNNTSLWKKRIAHSQWDLKHEVPSGFISSYLRQQADQANISCIYNMDDNLQSDQESIAKTVHSFFSDLYTFPLFSPPLSQLMIFRKSPRYNKSTLMPPSQMTRSKLPFKHSNQFNLQALPSCGSI